MRIKSTLQLEFVIVGDSYEYSTFCLLVRWISQRYVNLKKTQMKKKKIIFYILGPERCFSFLFYQ